MERLLTNANASAAVILFAVGFATLLLNNNMVKKIIGMNIMDTAVMLFLVSKGYIAGRTAPIVGEVHLGTAAYVNPIPASLILTGIVVAVSTTAVLLALTVRLYEAYGTLDIRKMRDGGGGTP